MMTPHYFDALKEKKEVRKKLRKSLEEMEDETET